MSKEAAQQLSIPYKFDPRPYQLETLQAFDSGLHDRFLSRWTRRGGKDTMWWNIMIKAAFTRVGMYFYVFGTYAQGKKVIWEGRGKEAEKGEPGTALLEHIPPGTFKANNVDLKITLCNGSVIRVIGSDDFNSVRGTNPLGVVFSEYAYQNAAIWEVVEPILMENGGWAAFESTPNGQNHFYKMEMDNLANKNWFISHVQSLWPDQPNYYPVISQEKLDELRRGGKTEEYLAQEYGASYTAGAKGNYYSDQISAARTSGRIGNYPYDDKYYVDVYTDLGWRDDTVLIFGQQQDAANVIIDWYENNTKPMQHYVDIIHDRGYRIRNVYMPHDGKQGKLQLGLSHSQLFDMMMKSAGINCGVITIDRPNNHQDIIDAVRARFSSYYFNEPKVAELVAKISLYHRQWDSKHQCFRDAPVHDYTSHAASALGIEALSAPYRDDGIKPSIPKVITDFDPLETTTKATVRGDNGDDYFPR